VNHLWSLPLHPAVEQEEELGPNHEPLLQVLKLELLMQEQLARLPMMNYQNLMMNRI
jgi:hypothetical protein